MDLSIFNQNNLLYTQESLSKYRSGGYHPVTLGDTFKDGRYKVHHKLGWGGFSTVWLAHDRELLKSMDLFEDLDRKCTSISRAADFEISREPCPRRQGDLSANYIVQLLDNFTHEGPNGVHQCLVFELLGPSINKVLSDYHEGQDKLWSETVLRMSTQLLKAVKFIHSAGMCYGDISGRNIAFTCTHLREQTEEQLFEVLGLPEVEPLTRLDVMPLGGEMPSQLVKAAEWIDWIDEDEEDIRLFDFGESFFQDQEPEKLAQPGSLRILETIFTDTFDYRVDLWRTGCMIYAFVFTTWPFWYLGEDEVFVFQMRFLPYNRLTAAEALDPFTGCC